MKTIALLMLALLCSAAGAAETRTYHYTCTSSSGRCPPPPIPPAPPAPPTPPVPPVPPAPPPMPEIPAKAHAACAGKAAGTSITYMISKAEQMTGTCESEGGKMLFILRSYTKEE